MSKVGLLSVLFFFLVFLKTLIGVFIYLLLIVAFIFFMNQKNLIIDNNSLIINYKASKKSKKFSYKDLQTIKIVHKDYGLYQIKYIEVKLNNNKNYKIICDGIFEEDEYEDMMFDLYLFVKEKFENTFFIDYYWQKGN